MLRLCEGILVSVFFVFSSEMECVRKEDGVIRS